MLDRRDVLKLGAAATVGASLVAGSSGAQDETPTGTETGTPTATETGTQTGVLAGDLYAATRMSGAEQVPPVDTQARGSTVFTQEDDDTIGYELYVADIENVTMAHIHLAQEGESGPVVQWLYPSADATEPQPIQGEFEGLLASDVITGENLTGPLEGATLDDLRAEMEAGNTYVNVHTEQNPDGEIRGQIGVLQQPEAVTTTSGAETQTEAGTTTEAGTPGETPTETPGGTPTEGGTATPGETTQPGG